MAQAVFGVKPLQKNFNKSKFQEDRYYTADIPWNAKVAIA